ncbi:MAG: DNA-binding response OmpR family regulator [Candidatus Poriferisodalaceae bacterium]|jgi:DNA-binding response OmpR family regulator
MDPIAIYPATPDPDLARLIDLAGYIWKPVNTEADVAAQEPDDGWGGAIVSISDESETAWAVCRALRRQSPAVEPILLLLRGNQLTELELRDELFDDFCLDPFHPRELEARLRHRFVSSSEESSVNIIDYGPLMLNIETYEAVVDNAPIDLTYMEYELLKFLAQHPGRVFTREVLLSRVWGYEYFGGARTVDVHIRRLRAKLGEQHASLIQTVRSVGYRFGQSRWKG